MASRQFESVAVESADGKDYIPVKDQQNSFFPELTARLELCPVERSDARDETPASDDANHAEGYARAC